MSYKDFQDVLGVLCPTGEWREDAFRNLKCPLCDSEYQHTSTPYLVSGFDRGRAGWGGRGDLLVIPMTSECGSLWELCLGSHKGKTAVFVYVVLPCGSHEKQEQVLDWSSHWGRYGKE